MTPFDNICKKVSEFNYLFGVINYEYNPENTCTFTELFDNSSSKFNSNQFNLRFNLIKEEVEELCEAYKNLDYIEVVDALCDILYVVAGAKVYFNLPNLEINSKIKNFSFDHFSEEIVTEEIKILMLNKKISDKIILINEFQKTLKLLTNDLLTIDSLNLQNDIIFYNLTLDSIVEEVFTIAFMMKINLIKLFQIVHDSNMSKICNNDQLAIDTVEWYKQNEKRYKNPSYKEIDYNNNKYFVVFDDDTKKILKSIKYNPVDFKKV